MVYGIWQHGTCCSYVSVRPSQIGVMPKRLNVSVHKQRHTTAEDSSFLAVKILAKLQWSHPNDGTRYRWGMLKSAIF